MIRYLLFSLLGFLGSALLLLIVRTMWYNFRSNLLRRKAHPDVIDVTPIPHKHSNRLYIIAWLLLGLGASAYIMNHMDDTKRTKATYIPAHIDAEGNFVPSQQISPTTQEKTAP